MSSHKPPLVVILGPTAVGKTVIAVQLATILKGEVISADSRLFYRGMVIGTAKPSIAERHGVPHHMIDIADPSETLSLSSFQRLATQVIIQIHARGKLPFIVGGTGQYIHAVTHGWTPPAVTPNDRLRQILESLAAEHGNRWLHEHLSRLDPLAAKSIDPRNLRRTVRALEVIMISGQRFSSQRRLSDSPYQLIQLGLFLPRKELYARVDMRIEEMFASGFLSEVQALLARGLSPQLPAFSAIGYREAILVLKDQMTVEQAKTSMRRKTRILVRRQANWFKRNDPSIQWFDLDRVQFAEIEDYLRNKLVEN